MKCPKCSYVSFDYLDACRRCSIDLVSFKSQLGLSVIQPGDLDLSIALRDSMGAFVSVGEESLDQSSDILVAGESYEGPPRAGYMTVMLDVSDLQDDAADVPSTRSSSMAWDYATPGRPAATTTAEGSASEASKDDLRLPELPDTAWEVSSNAELLPILETEDDMAAASNAAALFQTTEDETNRASGSATSGVNAATPDSPRQATPPRQPAPRESASIFDTSAIDLSLLRTGESGAGLVPASAEETSVFDSSTFDLSALRAPSSDAMPAPTAGEPGPTAGNGKETAEKPPVAGYVTVEMDISGVQQNASARGTPPAAAPPEIPMTSSQADDAPEDAAAQRSSQINSFEVVLDLGQDNSEDEGFLLDLEDLKLEDDDPRPS